MMSSPVSSRPTLPSGRPASHRWPAIIVGLLAAHVTLMIWAVGKATHNNTAITIPDYYAKSLQWDADKAALAAGTALGWQAKLEVVGNPDELGRRMLRVTLVDAEGKAIAAESVSVSFHHDSHANYLEFVTLRPTSPGHFEGQATARWAGFHRFSVRAHVGGRDFVQEWTQFVGLE